MKTFDDFYPIYLSEHSNRTNRQLHFIGTTLGFIQFILFLITQIWYFLPLGIVTGYSFAWVGHFFFELNKPASFKKPLYSLMGDYVMWKDVVTGKIPTFF